MSPDQLSQSSFNEEPSGRHRRVQKVLRMLFPRISEWRTERYILKDHRLPIVPLTQEPPKSVSERIFDFDAAQIVYGAENIVKEAAQELGDQNNPPTIE